MLSASRSPADDPLAHVFAPPLGESQRDKENRLRAEQEAKKRSDAIDEEINKQRVARKNSKPVKVLLLGESILLPPLRARSQIADGVTVH
jgi:guanine nucleotide-binding protein subunit alpha